MLAETLLDCLQLVFSAEVFKLMVEHYLEQQSNNGADDSWVHITIAEMKAFMGIHITFNGTCETAKIS